MSLTLVATPIGNMGDLSPRARQALEAASFWVVEDTRVSGRLQQLFEFKRPMTVLNDHTSPSALEKLADRIVEEGPAVLLTDAGSPAISDPGADLVDILRERDVEIDAIPGPSAVTQSLVLSGFFAQRYAFLGFLPRKPGPAKEVLKPFAESTYTLVFFESQFRINALLNACHEVLGERRFAICRELTKMHQQVHRGVLGTVPTEKEVPRKGEFTVVIEGLRRKKGSEEEI